MTRDGLTKYKEKQSNDIHHFFLSRTLPETSILFFFVVVVVVVVGRYVCLLYYYITSHVSVVCVWLWWCLSSVYCFLLCSNWSSMWRKRMGMFSQVRLLHGTQNPILDTKQTFNACGCLQSFKSCWMSEGGKWTGFMVKKNKKKSKIFEYRQI